MSPSPLQNHYDLVVVGSGIAGLYAALLAAPHRRVLLVTKGLLEESNTRYAQGGIAVALRPDDSPELHLRDTIAAGDGLCDVDAVSVLTRDAPGAIVDLIRRGVPFDGNGSELAWTLEAAHSLPRVIHAGGDATGASVEETLSCAVRAAGVTVQEWALCTHLVKAGHRIVGVTLLLQDGASVEVHADAVILATGGAGRLFARTTNPEVATGDGLALAYRAGAQLIDLEFFQFHPTALVLEGAPSFLISEAVRGEGGILRDVRHRAFMHDYHPDGELAPRDVVARSIHREMEHTDSSRVYLDITHLPAERIERRFPTIVAHCRRHGIDPVRDLIPVAPAAHYLMGGIRTDVHGRTTLPGLYACGEAACTGVHGANRLASNSLLEGLVFARRAVGALLYGAAEPGTSAQQPTNCERHDLPAADGGVPEMVSQQSLADVMWRDASVVRSEASLRNAMRQLKTMQAARGQLPHTREEHERANLMLLAELMLQCALMREESRGAHFRQDYPDRDPRWGAHLAISMEGVERVPLRTAPTRREASARV